MTRESQAIFSCAVPRARTRPGNGEMSEDGNASELSEIWDVMGKLAVKGFDGEFVARVNIVACQTPPRESMYIDRMNGWERTAIVCAVNPEAGRGRMLTHSIIIISDESE
jgi:hypothetical protein